MPSSPRASDVFVDYLTVTYHPDRQPFDSIATAVRSCGGYLSPASEFAPDPGRESWVLGTGLVMLEVKPQWARASFSGGACACLRSLGAWGDVLLLLRRHEHTVTRVDLSRDVFVDAAPVIAALYRRYPDVCRLSHKPQRTYVSLAAREDDGVESGTFGSGKRKHGASAIVYDKRKEAWDKRKEEHPHCARYEIRLTSGVRPTLHDAQHPAGAFWHYAGGTLLPRPADAPRWDRCREYAPWASTWFPLPPMARLLKSMDSSPELKDLARLAVASGPEGPAMARRRLLQVFDAHVAAALRADAAPPASAGPPPAAAPVLA